MQKPDERLKKKVQKENLWLFILSLLNRQEMYGYEVRELIKKRFGFLSGSVTAYKVLYLLERGGYVSSRRGRKRYYKITASGREQLKKSKMFFETVLSSLK
jgi:DNA-binding PadR family transcriptional regulator